MKRSRLGPFLVTLAVLLAAGPLRDSAAQIREVLAQDTDKTLDITRYSNEPLKLVDLRVGEQDIKDKIKGKARSESWSLETVTFKERNGWFKHILIKMRNVSGRPIYGATAYLYFAPPGSSKTVFSLSLLSSTLLKQGVAEPGDEITFTVSDQAWNLTADILDKYGVNPDLASVQFSIESIRFASDLQWMNGQLLRPDPNNPNKWNVIDMKVEP
jgi:hypothetical protein